MEYQTRTKPPYLIPLLGLVGATLGTEYLLDIVWMARYAGWWDFRVYYTAAIALKTGRDIYDIQVLNAIWQQVGDLTLKPYAMIYIYLPPFAAAVIPLTWIPFLAAVRVWLVFNALLWLVGLWLLFAFLDLRPRHLLFWILGFAALRFEPVLTTLKQGQVNILLFVLVMASLYSLKKRRHLTSGLFLASAVVLKLTPLVLVGYYLFRRNYRAVLWTCAFISILLGIGWAFAGLPAYLKYARQIFPFLSEGFDSGFNQSLTAWFTRLFRACGWAGGLAWARLLALSVGGALALIALRCLRKAPRQASGYTPAEISLCILLMSFVSPTTWSHHMVWIILPFAVVFRYIAENGASPLALGALLAAYASVGVLDDFYVHPIWSGPLVLVTSIKLYGLLVIYLFLLKHIGKMDTEPVPEICH